MSSHFYYSFIFEEKLRIIKDNFKVLCNYELIIQYNLYVVLIRII